MEYFHYIEHYFDMASAVPFFLVSLAGLVLVMGVILALARIRQELDKKSASAEAPACDRHVGSSSPEANARDRHARSSSPEANARDRHARSSSPEANARDRHARSSSLGANAGGLDTDACAYEASPADDLDLSALTDTTCWADNSNPALTDTSRSADIAASSGAHRNHQASASPRSRARRPLLDPVDLRPYEFIESFYEMAFASTSILLLLSLYYIIGDRINLHTVNALWDEYKDWVLIGFLLLSMIVDRIFDHILVPLHYISAAKRGSVRLMASIYVMLILLYIRFIYEDYNYEQLILYFVMLVIGRLVYFDVTWDGFRSDFTGILRNLPVLLLMCAYSAAVVWYGFSSGFLLKANGVIVSTLIAHLFMDVCIFLFDRSKIWRVFLR